MPQSHIGPVAVADNVADIVAALQVAHTAVAPAAEADTTSGRVAAHTAERWWSSFGARTSNSGRPNDVLSQANHPDRRTSQVALPQSSQHHIRLQPHVIEGFVGYLSDLDLAPASCSARSGMARTTQSTSWPGRRMGGSLEQAAGFTHPAGSDTSGGTACQDATT